MSWSRHCSAGSAQNAVRSGRALPAEVWAEPRTLANIADGRCQVAETAAAMADVMSWSAAVAAAARLWS